MTQQPPDVRQQVMRQSLIQQLGQAALERAEALAQLQIASMERDQLKAQLEAVTPKPPKGGKKTHPETAPKPNGKAHDGARAS